LSELIAYNSVMDVNSYTTVILAGGRASRMGGCDKGLALYKGQPLIRYAITVAESQSQRILISANRNQEEYRAMGLSVYADNFADYSGPLAGLVSCAPHIETPYTIVMSCDMPDISAEVIEQLKKQLCSAPEKSSAAVFRDQHALQCGLFVCETSALHSIQAFLDDNHRSVKQWLNSLNLLTLIWSEDTNAFKNINRLIDL